MVKYAKANPGKVRYMSNQVGSATDIACEWVLQQLGAKVKKIPQQSIMAALSVLGAGEGDFTMCPTSYVGPHVQAGRIDLTMFMGESVPSPFDKDPTIVSSKALGLPGVPMGASDGFAVPKNVSQAHIDWLFKLFKAGASTDVYKQREKSIMGLMVKIRDPADCNKLKYTLFDFADPVVRSLGMHWEQQQKK
jgi:tripartite-type tricarboxylate transporter receptor subunit TctC